ncbi:transcriptional regulator, partial [Lacticaseibacillus rhamnosus]
ILSQEPLTTVYRLTARGETVKPVIEGMAEWIKF